MAQVRWSNGQADRAHSWEALESKIRNDQWWDLDPDEFRIVMQKRAYRWSLIEITTLGTSEEFFKELERARLIVIESDDSPTKEEV
jgi:hypothetical protein